MSASTALAAFLAGTPLVYVDYGTYLSEKRIPVAGSEYPRLLANPLEAFGDLEFREIFSAFNRSDFLEAEHLAQKLATRLYEPREAQCIALLASGYGAWDRFDFKRAHEALEQASMELQRFASQGGWDWAPEAMSVLDGNLHVLKDLAKIPSKPAHIEEGMPLLAWYLSAAQRLLEADKSSLAVLLTYAAVERYVNLCLWVEFGLDDEHPDYGNVRSTLDLDKYHRTGRLFFGKDYKPRELDGALMFGNGVQLLATLKPDRIATEDLGPIKGLSNARNKCEYEHGLVPKSCQPDEARKYLDKSSEIIARVYPDTDGLNRELKRHRFPRFGIGKA